jgi:formylglycine-generating enzyme required for sulfatase activity
MAQVFISYSRVDAPFVELLIRRLQHAFPDLKIWYDQAPHGLIGGGDWWDDIFAAIAASDVFIYVLSNESVSSRYCQAEFTEARRLRKRIIPLQARDRTELTGGLEDIQIIDMKDGVDAPEALSRLYAALAKRLKEAQKFRNVRPLWKPATPKPPKEAPPTRTPDAPEIETPPLEQPPAERRALEKKGVRWQIIGTITIIALILGILAFILVISTPDPLQAALDTARTFTGSNTDWQTLYTGGFTHTFADGVPIVLVPAGCFMMGSTNGLDHEQAVLEQCFNAPFWIDLTEVTQADFERLGGVKANDNGFDGDQRPVERITWFEARDFCALRDARLPTEREWEYAARGPDNLTYPWGSAWNENNAVWDGNSNSQTAEVGSRPAGASWVGALDMSGNVWEWVSSLYLPYDSSEDRESNTGTRTDVLRVLRGGSWVGYNSDYLRAAIRGQYAPGYWSRFGFRCARSS